MKAVGGTLVQTTRPEQVVQFGKAIESERDSANPNVVIVTRWESASDANIAERQGSDQPRCE